jgi:prepilin-type N-terminal cleavage/methylation domain-containing protein
MLDSMTQKKQHGFSLLEMLIVVAVILILGAITVPRVMNTVSDINLRYFASNFGGLLQSARIQAVRRNAISTIQQTTLASGGPAYYIDPANGAYANGDPVLPVGTQLTVFPGGGSTAPNENAFTTGRGFTVYTGASLPSFNARGLPCIAVGTSCPEVPGQGFAMIISKSTLTGNVNYASVVINPSGRVQIWTCDSAGTWIQR